MTGHLSPEDYKVAAENGISEKLAYTRFYIRGWSKERAITQPVKSRAFLWNQYKDISKVGRTGFYYRISQGLSPEQAALTPSQRKDERI